MKIAQHMEAIFVAAAVVLCSMAYSPTNPTEVTDPGPASFAGTSAQQALPDRRV